MDLTQKTLENCIEEFLVYISSVRRLSDNTVTGYAEDFIHLKDFLGNERLVSQVSLEDLRMCIGELSREKYSVTSINRFISAVRGLFFYLKKFNIIQKNPALELKTLRAPKHLPKFMTQTEVEQMCRIPRERELLWPMRDLAVFEMLYSSGCRVSELASLKFSDFTSDFSSAIVRGKGSKDRRVYFEKEARFALKRYLLERKQRFPQCEAGCPLYVENIFINQKGTMLTAHGIGFIVKTYSGVQGTNRPVTPHAFRHTFATTLLNNGADIRIVQELLGHSNISTTQRYTHVTTEHLIEVYKQAFPHSGN